MRAHFSLWIAICMLLVLAGCYRGVRPKGIGNPAPDFTLQDGKGTINLAHLRGQVVVLNFWASWCPPCIDETPSLVSMQQRLKDKGVTVVGVSADEDPQAYQRFIKEYGINFLTVRDPSERVEHLYGTVKIPETYIIDRKGVLRRKFVSEVNWNSPEVLSYLSTL
jgi:peroxiredoxin